MRKKNKCGVVCDMGHTAQESGCRQAIHVVGVGRQTPGKFESRQKQRTGRSSCGKGNPHTVKGSRAHFLSAMMKVEVVRNPFLDCVPGVWGGVESRQTMHVPMGGDKVSSFHSER